MAAITYHRDITQDAFCRAAGQQLGADELGQRGLLLPNVLHNLLVNPGLDTPLHQGLERKPMSLAGS